MKTANQLQITSIASYHFSLYYTKTPFQGGLNIERAKSGYSLSNLILNTKDVETLEVFFTSKGIIGQYTETKSKNWARCQNNISKELMVELTKFLRTNKIKFGK